MKTTSPDRSTYSITRRWMPWRRRIRHQDTGDTGYADPGVGGGSGGGWFDGDDLGVLALIGIVVLLALLVPTGLIFVGMAIELALLLTLLPLAVLGRALFGLPWEVEVRDVNGGVVWPVVHTEQVKGWSASGQRIHELSEQVRLGQFTPGRTLPHDDRA